MTRNDVVTAQLVTEIGVSHDVGYHPDERRRIARDLHDTVIQRLFATGLTIQAVSGRTDGAIRDEAGLEKCVACGLCSVACPADAIYLEAAENDGTVQAVHYTVTKAAAQAVDDAVDQRRRLAGDLRRPGLAGETGQCGETRRRAAEIRRRRRADCFDLDYLRRHVRRRGLRLARPSERRLSDSRL